MSYKKQVNIAIIIFLLAFLLWSYLLEHKRIVDELAYIKGYDYHYHSHEYEYDIVLLHADYIYEYGLLHNCPEDEKNHILQNTKEYLDMGALTQDDYDNLMKIYYGGFLLSDYLKDHDLGDYYYFNYFIGTSNNTVGYKKDGEWIYVNASVYGNGKPYWKGGEIYIVTEEADEFGGSRFDLYDCFW